MPIDPRNPTTISLADAPGGDLDFDTLFPNPEVPQPTTAAQPAQGTPPQPAPQAQPAAPAAPEWYLRSQDGRVVYKTQEEAVRGLSEKDQLIERLRQREIAVSGVDPVTGKFVGRQPSQPVNYVQAPEKLYDDLSEATSKNDKLGFARTLQQYVSDILAPVTPVFGNVAKRTAMEELGSEFADFSQTMTQSNLRATLEDNPDLKNAIENSEANPNFYGNLKGLYRIAYYTTRGRMQAQPQAVPAAQPQVAAAAPRPTLTPTSLGPTEPQLQPRPGSPQARKDRLAELDRMVPDQPFEKFTGTW